jgi:surface antigen
LLWGVLLAGGLTLPSRHVEEHTLCSGYAECRAAGYGDFGYGRARRTSWWEMGRGSNCTNFVAYRLVRAGMPNRRPVPDPGRGGGSLDAYRWGVVYASRTDSRPTPGAVAWWDHHRGRRLGHVALVESVNPDGSLTISEDSATGRGFDWKRITRGRGWPSGFIHFPASGRRATLPDGPELRPAHRARRVAGRDAQVPDRSAGSVSIWVGPAAPPARPESEVRPPVTDRPSRGVGPDPHLRPR